MLGSRGSRERAPMWGNRDNRGMDDRQPAYTVGHSTRSIDELRQMLRAHGIELIADVRTVPRSRHNPQYEQHNLRTALGEWRIGYTHYPDLGGLRRARQDSPNTGWRNASFRGFADYMQTEPFRRALDALLPRLAGERTALMCAEAVPWRCHRSLIADALLVRGIEVLHIMGEQSLRPHVLTRFAQVRGLDITYPAEQDPANP